MIIKRITFRRQVIMMSNNNKVVVSEEMRGKGIGFNRIRRITGYLVGDLDRFNNAKRSEVRDRVNHKIVKEVNE